MLIGGIEAGGTKIVCGAAEVTEEGIHILDRMRFATGRPEEAVRKAADISASLSVIRWGRSPSSGRSTALPARAKPLRPFI